MSCLEEARESTVMKIKDVKCFIFVFIELYGQMNIIYWVYCMHDISKKIEKETDRDREELGMHQYQLEVHPYPIKIRSVLSCTT